MHEAVFEAGWRRRRSDAAIARCLRRRIAAAGAKCSAWIGRMPIMSAARKIWGVKKAWDHVEHRLAPYQTVVTAVIANRDRLDGIEVRGAAAQSAGRGDGVLARDRAGELCADGRSPRARVGAVAPPRCIVWAIRSGRRSRWTSCSSSNRKAIFPQAHYAFDNGVLTLELTRGIERAGQTLGQ